MNIFNNDVVYNNTYTKVRIKSASFPQDIEIKARVIRAVLCCCANRMCQCPTGSLHWHWDLYSIATIFLRNPQTLHPLRTINKIKTIKLHMRAFINSNKISTLDNDAYTLKIFINIASLNLNELTYIHNLFYCDIYITEMYVIFLYICFLWCFENFFTVLYTSYNLCKIYISFSWCTSFKWFIHALCPTGLYFYCCVDACCTFIYIFTRVCSYLLPNDFITCILLYLDNVYALVSD